MLKIPPFGDEEEEITTIHLKIKLFSGLNHFITSTYFSCYSVFELQLYGLQVKQRFEILKKRRVPGSFTEQDLDERILKQQQEEEERKRQRREKKKEKKREKVAEEETEMDPDFCKEQSNLGDTDQCMI
nr:hypothetical protein CFP56_77938 [Quercus suber]